MPSTKKIRVGTEEIKAGIEAKGKQRGKGIRKMWKDIRKLRKEIQRYGQKLRKGMVTEEKGKKSSNKE